MEIIESSKTLASSETEILVEPPSQAASLIIFVASFMT